MYLNYTYFTFLKEQNNEKNINMFVIFYILQGIKNIIDYKQTNKQTPFLIFF